MIFDYPLLLWIAPAAALVVLGLAWAARSRRLKAAMAWSELLAAQTSRVRSTPPAMGVVALLVVIGIAGPRWGNANISSESRALNLVVAIDISRSMLAEDVAPNRLGRAVRETRRLLQDAQGDRVGLLAFAGRSYALTPLTLDHGAVELQLDALDPGIASEGGTELAGVLRQGIELLDAARDGGARVLVVFTDGEAHDSVSAAVAAARKLGERGVTVIFVGAGGVAPSRIPLRDENGRFMEYKKDDRGMDAMTYRRDDVLRSVTDAARGVLIPADLADQAGEIARQLSSLDRSTTSGGRVEDFIPRAWLFALTAFLLLAVETVSRRAAALAALAGVMLLPVTSPAQRPAEGHRRLQGADTIEAINAYSRAARGKFARDTSWYNAGTVALAAGKYLKAREALSAAAQSLDPDLRFLAIYNLGLAALRESRRDPAKREELRAEAAARFREALTLHPASANAKWNLELASRDRPNSPNANRPKAPPKGGQQPQQSDAMSSSEAEQILRSVERAESDVRKNQVRRHRARSSSGKDW